MVRIGIRFFFILLGGLGAGAIGGQDRRFSLWFGWVLVLFLLSLGDSVQVGKVVR